jgi:hypothetical protein
VRPVLERFFPAPGTERDSLRWLAGRLLPGFAPDAPRARRPIGVAAAAFAVLVVGTGIVVAGIPARGAVVPASAEVLNRLPSQVDPGTLPPVVVGQDVHDYDPTLAGDGIQAVLVTLAQNLEYESLAILRGDPSILTAVNHGDRLVEMQARVRASAGATRVVERYTFDSVSVRLLIPFGAQEGFSLGLDATGDVIRTTYAADGTQLAQETDHLSATFAMRRATGDRWLTIAVLPPGAGI